MTRSRIYATLAIATIVVYAAMVFILTSLSVLQLAVIGAALLLLVVVVCLVINKVLTNMTVINDGVASELVSVREELATARGRLSEITTIDEVTGCSNHRHFVELLGQHRAMSVRGSYLFAVAVMRVDQFHSIVETHGLGRGNEVLQLFSRIVKAALREVDVLARFEADKFGLVLSGASEEEALHVVDRIGQLIGQIRVNDTDDLKITSSGGITIYHGSESTEELISHAEQALDFAIQQGGDCVAGYNYVPPEEADTPQQA